MQSHLPVHVRPTKADDIPALEKVLDDTALFPSDLLPDMVNGFLSDETTDDLWFTAERSNEVLGFCYAAPEERTDGTWNMLAIAVLPSTQGSGVGSEMVRALEVSLREKGQRVLIADTSGQMLSQRHARSTERRATPKKLESGIFGRQAATKLYSGRASPVSRLATLAVIVLQKAI